MSKIEKCKLRRNCVIIRRPSPLTVLLRVSLNSKKCASRTIWEPLDELNFPSRPGLPVRSRNWFTVPLIQGKRSRTPNLVLFLLTY